MLKAYLNKHRNVTDWLVDISCFFAFVIALVYLLGKTFQQAEFAGFDFKYIWLAGELWGRGINPYSDQYFVIGQQVDFNGHVPLQWSYPPNWFIPSSLVALTDVNSSCFIANLVNVAMLLVSSALLTMVYFPYINHFPQHNTVLKFFARFLQSPINIFFLHIFACAVLQVTALTLSTGQTSILIYFGISLLLYGMNGDNGIAAVVGLVIILLKPQIGIMIVVALLMMGGAYRILVIKAVALSGLISLPAFVVSPIAAFEWVANVGDYDGFLNKVNAPQEMTGIRHLLWGVSDFDIGNIPAMLISIVAIMVLCLPIIRRRFSKFKMESEFKDSLCLVLLACATTIAVAPLHIYDFMIVAVLLFVFLLARLREMLYTLAGFGLIVRADDLAELTGFYSSGTQYFEGTKLAAIGALFILIAVFNVVRYQVSSEVNSNYNCG